MKRVILVILIVSLFPAIDYWLPSAFASAANNNEILINEVELNPAGNDIGAEKVELYNPSSSAIDVNGWTISSTAGTRAGVTINEQTIIPPEGFLIVDRDSQQWLDNTGEGIELRNNSGILTDHIGPFSDRANDDATWQRSLEGEEEEEDNWVFSSNTLGDANFGTFVSDAQSPSPPLAREHPIITQPKASPPTTTTANSTAESATLRRSREVRI